MISKESRGTNFKEERTLHQRSYQGVRTVEKDTEIKKMSLKDILEYADSRGMSTGALAKLEETYRELLKSKDNS